MSVVGFDIGNSKCVITIARKGGLDVIANEVSKRETATMVAFCDKVREMGEGAATQRMRNLKNTITNMLCLLGRKFSDPEVQEEIKQLPFTCVELPSGFVGCEVMYEGQKKVFTMEALMGQMIQKLKKITEVEVGQSIRDIVLSVPPFFNDTQRRAMRNAVEIAGLKCLRMLSSTCAAALLYGFYNLELSETDPAHFLIVDFGHTALTATVIDLYKNKLKVVATASDRSLGGRNFDRLLLNHFVGVFKDKYKFDVSTNARASAKLQDACEKLKKVLSSIAEAPIQVECLMNDTDVASRMTREEFETLAEPLLNRIDGPITSVLAQAGLKADQLSSAQMIGGSHRIPAFQKRVSELLGQEVGKRLNSSEAVSKGAAVQCALLSPLLKVRDYTVQDISCEPIEVVYQYKGPNTMEVDPTTTPVFSENSSTPCSKLLTFNYSEGVDLSVKYTEGSEIGAFSVTGVPEAKTADAKLKVKLRLDPSGIIEVPAAELVEVIEVEEEVVPEKKEAEGADKAAEGEKKEGEGEAAAAPAADAAPEPAPVPEKKIKKNLRRCELKVVSKLRGLSNEELQKHVKAEAAMLAADVLAVETAECRNAVESYVLDQRRLVEDSLREYIKDEDRSAFFKTLDETEDWLYGDGEDTTKGVYMDKLAELKRVGDPISIRHQESQTRPAAVENLRNAILWYSNEASSNNEKYSHISDEDKAKVVADASAATTWLDKLEADQAPLAKWQDPVLWVKDIKQRGRDLERVCGTILNKPKPAPKPEPKPEPKADTTEPAPATSEPAKPAEDATFNADELPEVSDQGPAAPEGDAPASMDVE